MQIIVLSDVWEILPGKTCLIGEVKASTTLLDSSHPSSPPFPFSASLSSSSPPSFPHFLISGSRSHQTGGRTAWSSIVVVNGSHYSARFWYDGAYMDQAREDAAEMALRNLTGTVNTTAMPPAASYYATA
jgi:hypothetical protein